MHKTVYTIWHLIGEVVERYKGKIRKFELNRMKYFEGVVGAVALHDIVTNTVKYAHCRGKSLEVLFKNISNISCKPDYKCFSETHILKPKLFELYLNNTGVGQLANNPNVARGTYTLDILRLTLVLHGYEMYSQKATMGDRYA